ncbi:hypothetical protein VB715_11585 [Crocosphaera sp. UHCC 0190]|uniref:hypothetical protein n=1 Tax=Crocosphaera sp. UHCC 0190 TaxID=3110246 RepID=UPI002B1FCB7D|nr:hypothetical protein [Crocosphaera sp. UHCC 0190]MEA5510407.1 hypothetical protein [Crocosphaera sp. UHCC 0190]
MSEQPKQNSPQLLTKPDQGQKVSFPHQGSLRQWVLFHKRLGTIVIALPIVWYALSGSLIAIGRDFELEWLYSFFQRWHSFQPVNEFTYQVINGFVAFSILALFVTGIGIWRSTREGKSPKPNQNVRKYHHIVSPVFGSVGFIFAITGWTNVLLRQAPESVYQLSRAIHNGSWLNATWLHCFYDIVCGLGISFLTITGLLLAKRRT